MNITTNSNIHNSESDNEISKIYRISKVHSTIMCVYFFALFVSVLFTDHYVILYFCIPCFIFYLIGFINKKYLLHTKFLWINNFITMLYISCFIIIFGWDLGVQYYVFVLLVIQLTAGIIYTKLKGIHTVILLLLCILLYGYSLIHSPLYVLTYKETVYLQGIHFLAVFVSLFYCLKILIEDNKKTQNYIATIEKKLDRYVSEDALTGLINRRTMMNYLGRVTDLRNLNGKNNICLAIGDVDYFGKINDRYGHDCGDFVLKQIANQLSLDMKDKGKIARWGGEQFILIFENATGEDAYYYLTRIQQHIRSVDFSWKDESISITMTYGLMEYNPDKGIDYCIVEADKKMFMGKESGKNTIIF